MPRRDPLTRPENILALAVAEIERIKALLARVTDGRVLVIDTGTTAGGDTTPPVEAGEHTLYGVKHTRAFQVTDGGGLNIDFDQGQIWIGGTFFSIVVGTLAMTDATTNYVFVNAAGAVADNTTGFPADSVPLATVVTAGADITSINDRRSYLLPGAGASGTLHDADQIIDDDLDTSVEVERGADDDTIRFRAATVDVGLVGVAGQWQLPVVGAGAGLLIGGDTQLYRSAANNLRLASGDSLEIDDANFALSITAANPRITSDAGDYAEYNRASNYYSWFTGSTEYMRLDGSALGGLTDYDLIVGDLASLDYGVVRIGDSLIGRTSYNVAALDLDGAVISRNMGGPVTGQIEFVWTESAGGGVIRFALPKSGVGNATYNPRSMLIAGPAVNDDDIVTVGYWQATNSIFHNLVCDTAGTGADLGVQNDLEVEGDIFTDSIKESTPGAGVTVDDQLLLPTLGITGGIVIGGDAQWYREAANVLGTPDSVRLAGHLRVGSVAAPANTTAGDLTAIRAVFGDDVAIPATTQTLLVQENGLTPGAGGSEIVNVQAVLTPDGATGGNNPGILVELDVRPTAASASRFFGMAFTLAHDAGAFDLTGASALVGIQGFVQQNVAGTTVANASGIRGTIHADDGAITTARVFDARQGVAGDVGSIGTLRYYDMFQNLIPAGGITTVQGLNVPNLGVGGPTNAIGIDIADQVGAGTLNLGIRNAGDMVQGGTLTIESDLIIEAGAAGNIIVDGFALGGTPVLRVQPETATDNLIVRFFPKGAAVGNRVGLELYRDDDIVDFNRLTLATNAGTEWIIASAIGGTGGSIPLILKAGAASWTALDDLIKLDVNTATYIGVAGITGQSGGHTITGGIGASDDLTLVSTSHATLGEVIVEGHSFIHDTVGNELIHRWDTGDEQSFDTGTNTYIITIATVDVIVGSPTALEINAVPVEIQRELTLIADDITYTATVNLIDVPSTITMDAAGMLLEALNFHPTIILEQAPNIFGMAVLFNNEALIKNPPTEDPRFGVMYSFIDQPTIQVDTVASALSMPQYRSFMSRPTFSAINGGTMALDNWYQFYAEAADIEAGFTVTNRVGFYYLDVFGAPGGTLTTQVGVDIQFLQDATTNIGIRNASVTVDTPVEQLGIVAADTIRSDAGIIEIAAAAARTMTSTPTIADGVDGQRLTLVNIGAFNITLQDEAILAGSNLRLIGSINRPLLPQGVAEFVFSASIGDWLMSSFPAAN